VTVRQAEHADRTEDVNVVPGKATGVAVALDKKLPPGQLLGTVRNYNGKPLKATLTVAPIGTKGAERRARRVHARPAARPVRRHHRGRRRQAADPQGQDRAERRHDPERGHAQVRPTGRAGAIALAFTALLLAGGCRRKKEGDVAELATVLSGSTQRSIDDGPWEKAQVGVRFRDRHSVRTSQDGAARLRFMSGGSLKMGPSTTIRFGPGKLAVDGELEAEDDAVLELEMGTAQIAAGSKAHRKRGPAPLRCAGRQRGGDPRFGPPERTAGQALDFELGGSRLRGQARQVEAGRRRAAAPADAGAGAVAQAADAGPPAEPGWARSSRSRAGRPGSPRPARRSGRPLPKGEHQMAAARSRPGAAARWR
jgi:hypothetical protein